MLRVSTRPRLPDSCAMHVSVNFQTWPTFKFTKPLQWFASPVAVLAVRLKHPNNSTSRKLKQATRPTLKQGSKIAMNRSHSLATTGSWFLSQRFALRLRQNAGRGLRCDQICSLVCWTSRAVFSFTEEEKKNFQHRCETQWSNLLHAMLHQQRANGLIRQCLAATEVHCFQSET